MSNNPSTNAAGGRRHKIVAILCLGLLLIAGLLLWAARRENVTAKEIKRLIAGLRASGVPINAADLGRLYPDPPPEQDASLVLSAAFNITTNTLFRGNAPFISGRDLPLRGTNMDEELRLATRQYCAATTGLMAAIPTNLPPGTRFPSFWDQGFQNARPGYFIRIRSLIQALGIHAVDAAESRDPAKAAEIIQHGFRFTQTINYEPSLVSYMIHHACANLAASAAARALNRVQFTDEQLLGIIRSMGDDSGDNLTNLWNAERCVAIWAFQSVKTGVPLDMLIHPNQAPKPFLTRLWERITRRKRDYSDEDFLHYLELIPRHVRAAQEPVLSAAAKCGALQNDYERQLQSEVGGAVLPNMSVYVSRRAEAHATRASLRVALAIERHRLEHHGMPPASLTELVPAFLDAVPRDPFDGQPLRYRRWKGGYVVYSLGPHGVDAGGRERVSMNQTNNYNLGITVER